MITPAIRGDCNVANEECYQVILRGTLSRSVKDSGATPHTTTVYMLPLRCVKRNRFFFNTRNFSLEFYTDYTKRRWISQRLTTFLTAHKVTHKSVLDQFEDDLSSMPFAPLSA